MKKPYLMAPGPSPVPSVVLQAMALPIIHHRTPEFEAVMAEVRRRLAWLFQTTAEVIPLAASGTGALEAAIVNTCSAGDRVIVVRAGKFGERWVEIARAYGLEVVELAAPYGETVEARSIAEALDRHPDTRVVLCQQSESSTGVLHDVRAYAEVTRRSDTILVVDAVSSLAIADLRMDEWGIDAVVAGSQKGLMLPPGLAFCAFGPRAWTLAAEARLPRYYFDLRAERKALRGNQAHFTPAVSLVVGLREVLRLLEAEGLANVFARHARLSKATRAGAEALGLTLFPRATPTPALTAVAAPPGIDGEKVVEAFARSHAITIAGGQGEMKGKMFRIAHMGHAAEPDVIVALAALEQVLGELGVPARFGAGVAAAQQVFRAGA